MKWLALLLLLLAACGGGGPGGIDPTDPGNEQTVGIEPNSFTIMPGAAVQFFAVLTGYLHPVLTWTVNEGCGEVTQDGLYIAPLTSTFMTCFVTVTVEEAG